MSKIKSFNKLKDFVDKLKPILYMRENHTKENPEKKRNFSLWWYWMHFFR